jgi:hypothetical protein
LRLHGASDCPPAHSPAHLTPQPSSSFVFFAALGRNSSCTCPHPRSPTTSFHWQHRKILQRKLPEGLKLSIAKKIENSLFSKAGCPIPMYLYMPDAQIPQASDCKPQPLSSYNDHERFLSRCFSVSIIITMLSSHDRTLDSDSKFFNLELKYFPSLLQLKSRPSPMQPPDSHHHTHLPTAPPTRSVSKSVFMSIVHPSQVH